MTDVAYEDFLTDVSPFAPSCPEIVAINAVRAACIEFCNISHWLIYEHDPVTLLAGIGTYDLELPTGLQVLRIIEARVSGRIITPKSAEQLNQRMGSNWRTAEGDPTSFTQLNPREVIVAPLPQTRAVNALTMQLAVTPTRDSDSVDQSLWDRWAEIIAKGALARILRLPGHQFTDDAKALFYAREFRAGANEARVERERGLTVVPLQVQMRSW